MIFDKNDNFIARAGFAYTQEIDAIEIGYVIDHKYWGKGYATEIVTNLLNWAENNLEHKEIFAFTLVAFSIYKSNAEGTNGVYRYKSA